MRPIEIVRMRVEDVDLKWGLITVPKSKTRAGERVLPITDRLREKLLVQIGHRESGWIFPSPKYKGKHIRRHALTQAWRNACEKAGVGSDLKLYCGRHTFGSDAMDATKNPFLVMKLLGHTELGTTRRYQHPKLDKVVELMNLRNEKRAESIN
jgi:integrase